LKGFAGLCWEGKRPIFYLWLLAAVVLALLFSGILFFKRLEETFADVV
jgi:ABC-type polysaccharide/polyol phosphate export permease